HRPPGSIFKEYPIVRSDVLDNQPVQLFIKSECWAVQILKFCELARLRELIEPRLVWQVLELRRTVTRQCDRTLEQTTKLARSNLLQRRMDLRRVDSDLVQNEFIHPADASLALESPDPINRLGGQRDGDQTRQVGARRSIFHQFPYMLCNGLRSPPRP